MVVISSNFSQLKVVCTIRKVCAESMCVLLTAEIYSIVGYRIPFDSYTSPLMMKNSYVQRKRNLTIPYPVHYSY